MSQVWLWVERDVGHGTVECGNYTYRNVMEMRSVVDQKVNEVVIGNTICGAWNGWVIPLVTIWKVLRADKGTWENWGDTVLMWSVPGTPFRFSKLLLFSIKESRALGGKVCSLLAHVECREREGTIHKPVPGADLLCHRHFLHGSEGPTLPTVQWLGWVFETQERKKERNGNEVKWLVQV